MLDKDFAEGGSGNSAPVLSSSRLALSQYSQNSPALNPYPTHKALPGFFLCILSSLYLPCFQQGGSCSLEGTSQAVLGSSDQQKGTSQPVTFSKK
jgi:hypothetical protein